MTPSALLGAREALQWAFTQLAQVTERPHTEAERLLAWVLHVDRTAVLAHPEWLLTPEQSERFRDAIQRRAANIPLPYILGQMAFYGSEFRVTPAVLIPRPETELLVELALERIHARGCKRVVDVGTGSGCIAITLAMKTPESRVWATDISAAALTVARDNADRHGVTERIAWVQADLLTPLITRFDLIVSNPPYVSENEWLALPRSVQLEPPGALVSGPHGLDAIQRLLGQAAMRLATGGELLMEIGENQGAAVARAATAAFEQSGRLGAPPRIHRDLAGKDRILEISLDPS